MTIELEKDIAENLIKFKLRTVKDIIDGILAKWNEDNAENFLSKARSGDLAEAENDAIDLRQLLIEESKLLDLIGRLSGE